jgi:Bacterial SH3 domain
MSFGRHPYGAILFAALAASLPVGAIAQSGSAGGSIGNDEKSITGSRPELQSVEPSQSSREVGSANCLIADPTGTPLNIRTSPNGKIVRTIANGERVQVLDQTRDPRGKQWVYIADASSQILGWVFREYLVCR